MYKLEKVWSKWLNKTVILHRELSFLFWLRIFISLASLQKVTQDRHANQNVDFFSSNFADFAWKVLNPGRLELILIIFYRMVQPVQNNDFFFFCTIYFLWKKLPDEQFGRCKRYWRNHSKRLLDRYHLTYNSRQVCVMLQGSDYRIYVRLLFAYRKNETHSVNNHWY